MLPSTCGCYCQLSLSNSYSCLKTGLVAKKYDSGTIFPVIVNRKRIISNVKFCWMRSQQQEFEAANEFCVFMSASRCSEKLQIEKADSGG